MAYGYYALTTIYRHVEKSEETNILDEVVKAQDYFKEEGALDPSPWGRSEVIDKFDDTIDGVLKLYDINM